MAEYKVYVMREDGKDFNCKVELPEDFYEVVESGNDKYDDLLFNQIESKISFEGYSYQIQEIEELEK